jgi:hypothetical protein
MNSLMLEFEQCCVTVEKVKTFMVCWVVLLESAKNQFLGVDPQDNIGHHLFGMK